MHMLSRKDLNSVELQTVRVSRNRTTVITANGEVQTHEEATVYVDDLVQFVTVQILEDTPAGLSLGELCEEHGYRADESSIGEKNTGEERCGRGRQNAHGGNMKATMTELEQANIAVEVAKKKVGPATGLASDVTMLLELRRMHLDSLSTHAMDIVTRIDDDVKVVRMQDMKPMEGAHVERPP